CSPAEGTAKRRRPPPLSSRNLFTPVSRLIDRPRSAGANAMARQGPPGHRIRRLMRGFGGSRRDVFDGRLVGHNHALNLNSEAMDFVSQAAARDPQNPGGLRLVA